MITFIISKRIVYYYDSHMLKLFTWCELSSVVKANCLMQYFNGSSFMNWLSLACFVLCLDRVKSIKSAVLKSTKEERQLPRTRNLAN